ncbi:MAG: Triosephosphate isomerase [Firmicutes bacterium]|nr:Triosephosphate isomerase [candidate division NPL-UPA2 bacterium]
MSSAHKPLVIGNWKMNGQLAASGALTRELVYALRTPEMCEVVLCPPFTALQQVGQLLTGSKIRLGAQNGFPSDKGAFTGEVSMAMVRDIGCAYVLVGHSERRQHLSEDDGFVARKVFAAVGHDLTPVLCVGESGEVRAAGDSESFVLGQIERGLSMLPVGAGFVLAYEPVWAIGTGLAATARDANAMLAAVREWLCEKRGIPRGTFRMLYGGSVGHENIADFTAQSEIDGALVGGASLNAQAFAAVVLGAAQGYLCTNK